MRMYQVYGLEILECEVTHHTAKTITYVLPNGIQRTERKDRLDWFATADDALEFLRKRLVKLIGETEKHLSSLAAKLSTLSIRSIQ